MSSTQPASVSNPAKDAALALLRSKGVEIFAQAIADGYLHVSSETHVLSLVAYPTGAWEVGLVPKKVDFDGLNINSHEIYVYRDDTSHVRGPCSCTLRDGCWSYWPD